MAKKDFCSACGNSIANCVCDLNDSGKPKPNMRLCKYRHDNGHVCGKEGEVSPNVRGGGPWYCCVDHARANGYLI